MYSVRLIWEIIGYIIEYIFSLIFKVDTFNSFRYLFLVSSVIFFLNLKKWLEIIALFLTQLYNTLKNDH